MFKFNNNHIFTGHIKQLLASFNLPTCKVYAKRHRLYKQEHGTESPEIIRSIVKDDGTNETLTRYFPYIKDGEIQDYIQFDGLKTSANNPRWVRFWAYQRYERGKKIHNYTKNLKIKNNIYDSYTHEYLGDYLRFLRDYDDLDLLPLYNCFSNRLCTNLLFECTHPIENNKDENHFIFNSSNLHYKIFMLPVKLFQDYTIAIDCASPVEICCGIYGKYQDQSDLFTTVAHYTYTKYGQMNFNKPILFSKLKELNSFISADSLIRLAQREADLKMFIKLPVDNKSTITVLEGNYISWNDRITEFETSSNGYTNCHQYLNHYIINYNVDYINDKKESISRTISDEEFYETRDFKPITQLQLLMLNTGESYPFSNALVEYLVDNVITQNDEISDNIKRAQVAIYNNTDGKISHTNELGEEDGIWDSRIRPIIYDALQHNVFTVKQHDGKDYLVSEDEVKIKPNREIDNLGYINRIAEHDYKYKKKDKVGKTIGIESLANVDIYPELYLDQKEN